MCPGREGREAGGGGGGGASLSNEMEAELACTLYASARPHPRSNACPLGTYQSLMNPGIGLKEVYWCWQTMEQQSLYAACGGLSSKVLDLKAGLPSVTVAI